MAEAIRMIAFGDVHIPHQDDHALEVLRRAVARFKPHLIVCLGDLLDCSQFSSHPPTHGVRETQYVDDLEKANELLDWMGERCERLVFIEGNHEYRIDRWAATTREGRLSYSMLAPRVRLTKGRDQFRFVPYGSASGKYPYFAVNRRLVAVHGWSYARHATKQHLTLSQGRSVIHGHTHRADASIVQNIWRSGQVIEARSAGCLCKLVPLYGTGSPVEWVHAFIVGYLGRRSDTLYTVPIMGDRAILPDGAEVVC